MRLLVDFDRVIFNSDKAIKFADSLAIKHGGDLKTWTRKRPRQRGGKGDLYSIWKHLKYYQKYRNDIDHKAFLKDYEKFHESSKNVLFPDAKWFLKKIQDFDDRILLTFAEQRFQKFKIKSAEAKKYFRKIKIVPTYKAPHLSKLISRSGPTVLVDDNPKEIDGVKLTHPEVITVRVRRPGAWYSNMESRFKDFEVWDLKQVYRIVKEIEGRFIDEKTAVRMLKKGKSLVYPTDTAYGLGVDATNLAAVNQLMKIKGRKKKPTHIVVSNLKMAKNYVEVSTEAEKVFKKFLPGPLTLVLPLKKNVPLSIKKLSGGSGTLGVRMPDNKTALNLVKKIGRPITTPGANVAGSKTSYTTVESFKQFFDRKHHPNFYLEAGLLSEVKPSTVAGIEGNNIQIFRKGPISKKDIASFLNRKS